MILVLAIKDEQTACKRLWNGNIEFQDYESLTDSVNCRGHGCSQIFHLIHSKKRLKNYEIGAALLGTS